MDDGMQRIGTVVDRAAWPTQVAVEGLRNLLYGHCGVYLGEERDPDLAQLIVERSAAIGVVGPNDYLRQIAEIQGGLDERRAVLKRLLPSPSVFGRHFEIVTVLRSSFADDLARAGVGPGGRDLGVWVVDCGHGGDAYATAMVLSDPPRGIAGRSYRVQVLATDNDPDELERARAGTYASADLTGLPAAERLRWFDRAGERFTVKASFRDRVRFEIASLDALTGEPIGEFDVILAAGALPFVAPPRRAKALASLDRSLKPGGLLFLGPRESAPTLSSRLRLVLYPGGAVYRKPAASAGLAA